MGKQVDQLINMLQTSLVETLDVLSRLSEAELDDPSEHPCAMGGAVRDLLTHNIDHERMHVGQIYSARYSLRQMQKSEADRLVAETLCARTPDDQWTIREMIEHTIYWERHSIDDLARQKLAHRLPADRPRLALEVTDPIYGKLVANDS